jgi:hypothetical protein
MKLSLLDIVQSVLNALDSDEVNSISDTVESQQVALIVRDCYYELTSNRNWPLQRRLIQLEGLSDLDKPNYLRAPTIMKELLFFKYEEHKEDQTRTVWTEVKYKEPDAFLRFVSGRNTDNTNVVSITDFSGSTLPVFNNYPPQYWTSFDDKHIVTDSYNVAVEDTLQGSKTQCLAYMSPQWVHEDDAIPDLPDEAFALLVEESKSTAAVQLKQSADQKAEQKAARQNRWLARKAWQVHGGIEYPNYGRKSRR